MIDFYKLVDDSIKKNSDKLIFNASYKHAQYLFKKLLELAGTDKAPVKITTGHLRKDFYEALEVDARLAINQGAHVSLIVLDNSIDLDDNAFAKLIKEKGSLYQAKKMITAPHFILVGDNRLRIETDHDQTKATASFNNPSLGSFLNDMFSTLTEPTLVNKISTTPSTA